MCASLSTTYPNSGGSLVEASPQHGQDNRSTSSENASSQEIVVIDSHWMSPTHVSTNETTTMERPIPGAVAVIPAYNEDRFIGSLVLKVSEYVNTVIVVDDGSTDDTALVAHAAGAIVVQHQANCGKGTALNSGLCAARVLAPQVTIILDADGQHCADDIPAVARPVLEGRADLVVGSRFLEQQNDIPPYRIIGQHALTLITNLLSGTGLTDSQSGFRAFSRRALKTVTWQTSGFAVESEMQFAMRECGLAVMEVPIKCIYAEPAKRNPIAHGLEVISGLLRLVGQYRPLLFFGVVGMLLLLVGLAWGIWVVNIYLTNHALAVGHAMISVLFVLLGQQALFSGIILHSVRGFLQGLLQSRRV